MALVIGVNFGFVTEAPTADPDVFVTTIDTWNRLIKITSVSNANKITEVGWYCAAASDESNFEIGLYSDNEGVPNNILHSSTTNAKGTTEGWKTVTVDWDISGNTIYWLGLQVDAVAGDAVVDTKSSEGDGFYRRSPTSSLVTDWTSGDTNGSGGAIALYAVVETAEPSPTIQGITSITGVQSITI